MTKTKFQEIKDLLHKGEKWGTRCQACGANGATTAGTYLWAGSKNVRITTCEHELAFVQEVLAKFEIVVAEVNHFAHKTEEQKKNGEWNGCRILFLRDQVSK